MNVNLWFARDNHGDITTILNSNSENTYSCPICNSEVIPKAIESKHVAPHFAHIDRNKCTGESFIHFWMKHKFIERGDVFTITSDEKHTYTCKDFKTEVTFYLESGVYRPDIVVETECGNEIVFEMAHKNKKKVQDYIDRWIELDKIVVEVDTPTLTGQNEVKEFKALYYKGKCFNFNKRDGGYYNTIGKLKEEMKLNNIYDIELVKKLDWFWRELYNFNNGNKNDVIQYLSLLIQDNKYDLIIFKILKLHKHVGLLSNAINLIKCNIEQEINDVITEYDNYEFKLNTTDNSSIKKGVNFSISCFLKRKDKDYGRWIESMDMQSIHKDIINKVSSLEDLYYSDWEDNKLVATVNTITKNIKIDNMDIRTTRDSYYLSRKFIPIEIYHIGEFSEKIGLKFSKSNINVIKSELLEYLKEKMIFINRNKENFEIAHKIMEIKKNYGEEYDFHINVSTLDDVEIYATIDTDDFTINNNEYELFEILYDSLLEHVNYSWCLSCDNNLDLSIGELKFFINKGLRLPKRCNTCRIKRKQNK